MDTRVDYTHDQIVRLLEGWLQEHGITVLLSCLAQACLTRTDKQWRGEGIAPATGLRIAGELDQLTNTVIR